MALSLEMTTSPPVARSEFLPDPILSGTVCQSPESDTDLSQTAVNPLASRTAGRLRTNTVHNWIMAKPADIISRFLCLFRCH